MSIFWTTALRCIADAAMGCFASFILVGFILAGKRLLTHKSK